MNSDESVGLRRKHQSTPFGWAHITPISRVAQPPNQQSRKLTVVGGPSAIGCHQVLLPNHLVRTPADRRASEHAKPTQLTVPTYRAYISSANKLFQTAGVLGHRNPLFWQPVLFLKPIFWISKTILRLNMHQQWKGESMHLWLKQSLNLLNYMTIVRDN